MFLTQSVPATDAGAGTDSSRSAQVTAGIRWATLPGAGTAFGSALNDILASARAPARPSLASRP